MNGKIFILLKINKINKINFIIYKKYYNINNYLRLGGKYSSLSILKISSSD